MQAVVVTSTALDLNDANLHLLLQHIDLVLLFDQLLLLSANLKANILTVQITITLRKPHAFRWPWQGAGNRSKR